MSGNRSSELERQDTSGGRVRRALVATTVGLTAFATLGAVPAAAAPAQSGCAATAGVETDTQNRFVDQLNQLRRSKGLATLAVNDKIIGPAADWSETMSGQDKLHHARDTGPDDGVEPEQDYVELVGRVVPNWTRVAENVGVTSLNSSCSSDELRSKAFEATDALHQAFTRSSGHYANMVGDHNQVGIGVHIDADQLWVTVRFAKGDLPSSPQPRSSAQTGASARYIDAVYQLFLSRPASGGDISFWSGSVSGGDRAALTRALSVSDEWAGGRVSELYRTVLNRDADAAGRRNWVGAIANGMQLETVAAGIYGSTERFNSSGGTNRGYVEGLYRDILGRDADAGGRDHWVAYLDRGAMSRTQVAAGFYGSIESRTDRVVTLYRDILDRAPDSAGLRHWAGQLTSLGDVVLAGTLASSEEFWNRSVR